MSIAKTLIGLAIYKIGEAWDPALACVNPNLQTSDVSARFSEEWLRVKTAFGILPLTGEPESKLKAAIESQKGP